MWHEWKSTASQVDLFVKMNHKRTRKDPLLWCKYYYALRYSHVHYLSVLLFVVSGILRSFSVKDLYEIIYSFERVD